MNFRLRLFSVLFDFPCFFALLSVRIHLKNLHERGAQASTVLFDMLAALNDIFYVLCCVEMIVSLNGCSEFISKVVCIQS